jgi:hypothetical protein
MGENELVPPGLRICRARTGQTSGSRWLGEIGHVFRDFDVLDFVESSSPDSGVPRIANPVNGRVKLNAPARTIGQVVRASYRMDNKFGPVSWDMPAFQDGETRLVETISRGLWD